MDTIEMIKQRYFNAGATQENIDFAINSVKNSEKKSGLIEMLSEDYNGMSTTGATALVEDLYSFYGGENRKINLVNFSIGVLLVFVGFGLIGFLLMGLKDGVLIVNKYYWVFLIIGIPAGFYFTISAGYQLLQNPRKNKKIE